MALLADMTTSSDQGNAKIQRLQTYLAGDPSNPALLADLADTLLQAGQPAAAQVYVEKTLQLNPADGPARYRLAVIEHQLGKLGEAIERLQGLLQEGVEEPAVRLELARAAYAQCDWVLATQTLETLNTQALPEAMAGQVCLVLMRSLHQQAELERGIAVGDQFLAVSQGGQGSVAVRAALATLYLDAEQATKAANLYRQALAQGGPLDAEMAAVGGYVAMQDGDLAEAGRCFEASLAQQANGRAYLGLGLAQATQGHLDQAKTLLSQATLAMPTHLGSWHALAWMHLLTQDLDAAQRAFEGALNQDRNFGDTYGGLALVAILRGQRGQADELIRTGHKLDPASLNVGMARTLLRQGKSLSDQAFMQEALKLLNAQFLSRDAARQTLFNQLLARRPGTATGPSRH